MDVKFKGNLHLDLNGESKCIYLSISFPVVHWLLVSQSRQLLVYWVVGVMLHNLLNFLSHFTSDHPDHRLPSIDHVIIWLGHLLSSMCTKRPYHFSMSSGLSIIVCVTRILSAMNLFHTFSIYWIQKAFGKTNTLRISLVSTNNACSWYYILDLKKCYCSISTSTPFACYFGLRV